MLMKSAWLFFISLLFTAHQSAKRIKLHLGDASCAIHIYERKQPIAHLIALHGNEHTCVESFLSLPGSSPFTLYEIRQEGNRLLKYGYHHKRYYFNPNRIFSDKGIKNTLIRNNQSYPAIIAKKIKNFSDTLLNFLAPKNPSKYIIAIHNNTEGNFSVKSFINSSAAARVYICKTEDSDDFFIVTQLSDFTFFKAHSQNVVLQSPSAKDDGSLSVYCQAKNIPYINIEAQEGHRKKQTNMLVLCQQLIAHTTGKGTNGNGNEVARW